MCCGRNQRIEKRKFQIRHHFTVSPFDELFQINYNKTHTETHTHATPQHLTGHTTEKALADSRAIIFAYMRKTITTKSTSV